MELKPIEKQNHLFSPRKSFISNAKPAPVASSYVKPGRNFLKNTDTFLNIASKMEVFSKNSKKDFNC